MLQTLRLLLLLLFCLASLPSAAQSKEDLEKAKTLYQKAKGEYNLEEYEEALKNLQEAYRLTQKPGFLYNIAQCQKLLGRNQEAIQNYKLYLEKEPNSPYKSTVEETIQSLQGNLPSKREEFNEDAITQLETTLTPETFYSRQKDLTQEKPTSKKSAPFMIAGGLLFGSFALGSAALLAKSNIENAGVQNLSVNQQVALQQRRKTMAVSSDVLLFSASITFVWGIIR